MPFFLKIPESIYTTWYLHDQTIWKNNHHGGWARPPVRSLPFFLKIPQTIYTTWKFTWPNNLEEQPQRLGKTTGQITAFFLKNTTNNLYYMKIYMTKQFGRTTTEVGQDHRSDHCLFFLKIPQSIYTTWYLHDQTTAFFLKKLRITTVNFYNMIFTWPIN